MIILNNDEVTAKQLRANFFTVFIILCFATIIFRASDFLISEDFFAQEQLINEYIISDIPENPEELTDGPEIFEYTQKIETPPTPTHGLSRFFDKLYQVERGFDIVLRIAYHGDSMIEDNHTVNAVRRNFERRFGQDFIVIDNYAVRGSSGLSLLKQDFADAPDYDLIILQYGANVLSSGRSTYKWYGDRMIKVIEHLRRSFSQADILVVSSADKAAKYGNEIATDTLVYSLIRSQEDYANATNSGFINIFDLMGGAGTMADWVRRTPPLGARDFIHLSPAGSRKIGNALYEQLENEYEDYKANRSD